MAFWSRRSLAFFLAIILLGTSTLVLGVSGLVMFRALRGRETSRLAQSMGAKAQTAAEALVLPVWNFDEPQVRRILETLLGDPAVVGVRVSAEGRSWSRFRTGASDAPTEALLSQGLPVESRQIRREGEALGTLEVVWTTRIMEEELGRIRTILVLGLLAFDLILVVGLYILIWVAVVRPIRSLEAFGRRVASGGSPWEESWREPPCLEMNNLHHSIREMVELLHQRYTSLMESEQRFKALFEGSSDAVYMRELSPESLRTPFLEVNETACRMLGYSRDELRGLSPYDISSADSWKGIDGVRQRLMTEERTLTNSVHISKDGRQIPVEVSAHRYEVAGKTYVMSAARDMSERQRLEDQLRHSQKMESLGLLAGGIAHDFNNLLQVMGSYSELLEEDLPAASEGRWKLEQILTAVTRATQLTRGLLTFSRRQVINPQHAELNALVHRVNAFLNRVIGEDIELVTRTCPEILDVFIDEGQIEQVMMNLATNARDAMPRGGTLSLLTERVEMDDEFVLLHGFGTPGPWACIAVSDTGTGMDEATRQKIFDPFFSTKPAGKGTGLGLAIVYGIILQHQGHINVYSEPGSGTTFRIYLPLAAEGSREGDEASKVDGRSLRGSECILLAEDEDVVRRVVASILEANGYTVIQARDGQDAVEQFEVHAGAIQLLLTDLRMPRMSGKEAFEAITSRAAGLPVIFMSGYPADIIQNQGELAPGAELMMKPFTPKGLLQKLREVLARTQDA